MELTLVEAAAILETTPEAVRARIRRGTLPGRKRDRRWVIDRDALPLDERARRKLRRQSDRLRAAVESVLPGSRANSAQDLAPFAAAMPVAQELRDAARSGEHALSMAFAATMQALGAIAAGHHHFHRDDKLRAFGGARDELGRAVAWLSVCGDVRADGWRDQLETDVLPRLGGLMRWAESLRDTKAEQR